jgi:hypothetical protein
LKFTIRLRSLDPLKDYHDMIFDGYIKDNRELLSTSTNTNKRHTMKDLNKHFRHLLDDQWQFLLEEWSTMEPLNNHRTSIKNVGQIKAVKNKLMKRLGPIPCSSFQ